MMTVMYVTYWGRESADDKDGYIKVRNFSINIIMTVSKSCCFNKDQ